MPLTRKTRLSGSSLIVTIPSQIAAAFEINSGDFVEIIPLNFGEIKIKKFEGKRADMGGVSE